MFSHETTEARGFSFRISRRRHGELFPSNRIDIIRSRLFTKMINAKCGYAGCELETVVHFVPVCERRRDDQPTKLCWQHGRDLIRQYVRRPDSLSVDYELTSSGIIRGILFDIEYLYCEEPTDNRPGGLYITCLLQIGGSFRLPFTSDRADSAALYYLLGSERVTRPLSHETMAGIIGSMGGKLRCAYINGYVAAKKHYEVQLHISDDHRTVSVETNIADAVALAIAANAPILVAPEAVSSFAEHKMFPWRSRIGGVEGED